MALSLVIPCKLLSQLDILAKSGQEAGGQARELRKGRQKFCFDSPLGLFSFAPAGACATNVFLSVGFLLCQGTVSTVPKRTFRKTFLTAVGLSGAAGAAK